MLRPHRGRFPRVHPSAFIDDSAQVIGDVEIGEESSVWMMVVIRGDVHRIRIGRRSNVQDGTIVHVMKDTHPTHDRRQRDDRSCGHRPWLHDRGPMPHRHGRHRAEWRRIGTGSIVAAGSLVAEDMVVPPRSLVMGSPAR